NHLTILKVVKASGKLYYFWAYMFYYHWYFSEDDRDKMFKKMGPIGYRVPRLIQRPNDLRELFDDTHDKFTRWIWEKVILYGKKYLSSTVGKRWELDFNIARFAPII